MPIKTLKEFLDAHGVQYVSIIHSPAVTAQEIAAAAHIPGKELAKTVMVRLDGELAMAVLPASCQVDFERLKKASRAVHVDLADERDFRGRFPGCELGAMPPFGNLFGMEVYVSDALAEDEEIAFNAGSHAELIRMKYADFERLVEPKRMEFAVAAL